MTLKDMPIELDINIGEALFILSKLKTTDEKFFAIMHDRILQRMIDTYPQMTAKFQHLFRYLRDNNWTKPPP